MVRGERVRHKKEALTLLVVVVFACVLAPAQSAPRVLGQQIIYKTAASHPVTDPAGTMLDAYNIQNPPISNVCDAIAYAFNSLAAGSTATVDARGYTTSPTCATTGGPIPAGYHGRVLLGNITITTTVTWKIPAGMELVGLGALNTIIKGSGLTNVLQMGNGSSQFGVKIKSLTVDCAGVAGCAGILNDIAEESSGVEDVVINNAPFGLVVDLVGCPLAPGSPQAANSGPYRNITIQYDSGCSGNCGSAIGVRLCGSDIGQIVRGLDNITVSACGVSNTASVGIMVVGASARIANSTISCSKTGIQIGDGTNTTHNVEIEDVFLNGTGTSTAILANANSSDIYLSNIATTASTLLNDSGAKPTLTIPGSLLGFYIRGECCDATTNSALATSAPKNGSNTAITWRAPSDYCSPTKVCTQTP